MHFSCRSSFGDLIAPFPPLCEIVQSMLSSSTLGFDVENPATAAAAWTNALLNCSFLRLSSTKLPRKFEDCRAQLRPSLSIALLGVKEIPIIALCNAQVFELQDRMPGAQVGTVDKFQGQEAAVVVVSMTASSAEDVPRGMDFLYSRNRINVAISRAKSLAIIVASPKLLEPPCSKIEQMALVNTPCYAENYSRHEVALPDSDD